MTADRVRRARSTLGTAGLALALAASGLGPAGPAAGAEPPPSPASDTLVLAPVGGPADDISLVRNGAIVGTDLEPATYALAGDFTDSPGSDVFLYTPGPGIDGILDVTPVGEGISSSFIPAPVSGSYTPIVGSFGYGPLDDILWYGPGGVPDTIWFFQEGGTHSTARVPVSGDYQPTVLQANDDEWDDIVWYAPGPAKDSMWLFRPGSGWYQSVPLRIDGPDYQLIPGRFGAPAGGAGRDRLVFASPTASSIWTFDAAGRPTSAPFSSVIRYEPIVADLDGNGADDILQYRPSGPEDQRMFDPDGTSEAISPLVVWGDYEHAVGDFDGNGRDDIAWTRDGRVTFWYFGDVETGYTTVRYDTAAPGTAPVTSTTEAAPT